MDGSLTKTSVAEILAHEIAALEPPRLPAPVRRKCEDLLIDIVGLCLTARREDYVTAALAGWDEEGPCSAIGHARGMSAAGAAFINGTAAHGEDFDDTFEGGPVHAGAVIVPAVLAACERYHPDGSSALLGIAVGVEVMCRLSVVAPKAVHKAGFHPTAVFGAMAAAAAVGAALKLSPRQLVDALGIVGSMAGGIIEYLAEGAWTKRLHPGWAAQSGLRAAARFPKPPLPRSWLTRSRRSSRGGCPRRYGANARICSSTSSASASPRVTRTMSRRRWRAGTRRGRAAPSATRAA